MSTPATGPSVTVPASGASESTVTPSDETAALTLPALSIARTLAW